MSAHNPGQSQPIISSAPKAHWYRIYRYSIWNDRGHDDQHAHEPVSFTKFNEYLTLVLITVLSGCRPEAQARYSKIRCRPISKACRMRGGRRILCRWVPCTFHFAPYKIYAHQLDKLFADNFALPILGYLYWTGDKYSDHETGINSATLAGVIIGQISFGILADWTGRTNVYGYELLSVSLASLFISMASEGAIEIIRPSEPVSLSGSIVAPNTPGLGSSSMRITAWLVFFRFIIGLGVGAEYPLTAAITSE